MQLDILAFGAHPDDVELSCGGTLIKQVEEGKKIGLIDLTQGEMGTRGTAETRRTEAENARKILGAAVRENLKMPDGFVEQNEESLLSVIRVLRKYRPETVLANAIHDRHPDHGRASNLLRRACFLSGLKKIETTVDGKQQEPWRPSKLYFYIQDRYIKPDFVVDISEYFDKKMDAVFAYNTQFKKENRPDDTEPDTPISTPDFAHFLEARAREFGRVAGFKFGEGFVAERLIGVRSLDDLV